MAGGRPKLTQKELEIRPEPRAADPSDWSQVPKPRLGPVGLIWSESGVSGAVTVIGARGRDGRAANPPPPVCAPKGG
jgi:hypothetical protein